MEVIKSLNEISIKSFHIVYFVLTNLNFIYTMVPNICFIGYNVPGKLQPTWWPCPIVASFWHQLLTMINTVPPIAYNTAAQLFTLVSRIHMSAKCRTNSLSFPAVRQRINLIMLFKKIECTRDDSKDQFDIWRPWLELKTTQGLQQALSISPWPSVDHEISYLPPFIFNWRWNVLILDAINNSFLYFMYYLLLPFLSLVIQHLLCTTYCLYFNLMHEVIMLCHFIWKICFSFNILYSLLT